MSRCCPLVGGLGVSRCSRSCPLAGGGLRVSRCCPPVGGLGVSRCCPLVMDVSRCCPPVDGLDVSRCCPLLGRYSDASYVSCRLSVLNVDPRDATFFSDFSNGQPAKVGKKALGGPDEVWSP